MPLDMDPQIRAEWCAALRSGEYEQGEGQLRAPSGGYCCLGVLCEVAVKAAVIGAPTYAGELWTYDGRHDYLPESVQKWAGLADGNPEVPFHGESTWLAAVNDEDHTFAEIADLIDGGVTP